VQRIFSYMFLAIFVLCASGYFSLLSRFSVNVPNADDFDAILSFLAAFIGNLGVNEKMKLIFMPHGDHLIALTRIFVLAFYYIFGEINFRWIILTANIAVPITCLLMILSVRSIKLIYLLPIVLLIFQPTYIEASLWAMAAVQNFWVMLFCLGAFLVAFRCPPMLFPFALLLSALAALSQGNGIFCSLILSIVLLLKKRKRESLAAALLFIGFLLVHLASIEGGLGRTISGAKTLVVSDYVLSFLGSSLAFRNHTAAVFIGFSLVSLFVIFTFLRLDRKNDFLFATYLFILGTAIANAFARIDFGVAFAYTQSRYTYTSILLVACCYLAALEIFGKEQWQRKIFLIGTSLSLFFALFSYYFYTPEARYRHELLTESLLSWKISGQGLEFSNSGQASNVLKKVIEIGVYQPPFLSVQSFVAAPEQFEEDLMKGSIMIRFRRIISGSDFILLSGDAMLKLSTSENKGVEIVLSNSERTYKVVTQQGLSGIALRHRRKRLPLKSGFITLISRSAIEPGTYRIGIIVKTDNERLIRMTRKNIVI